jgi:hypothetical protein
MHAHPAYMPVCSFANYYILFAAALFNTLYQAVPYDVVVFCACVCSLHVLCFFSVSVLGVAWRCENHLDEVYSQINYAYSEVDNRL